MRNGDGMPEDCQDRETPGSGLYVDVENLHTEGQSMVSNLIENWPDRAPPPSRLSLYVRADQVELWRLWAESRFAGLEVAVRGTQHFSLSPTKNSADMAIATNAMADLVLQRVGHVVVLSDDSDFISLYSAIRDEPGIPRFQGEVPFLWVVTDREGSLSATVRQFFPPDRLHLVSGKGKNPGKPGPVEPSPEPDAGPGPARSSGGVWTEMARAVAEGIEVGQFKSTDCQGIIRERWTGHPLASVGGPSFGMEFKNNIWPVLQGWGARIGNPGQKPIRYEMTEEAKANAVPSQ